MQLHNVHNLILEQPEVKAALDVVRAKETDRKELPGRYAAEYAAWERRARDLHPSEGIPPEPPAGVPMNVDESAKTRIRLAEKDLIDVVTPLHSDLLTLLKEREVELLDEVRGLVERINGIGEEIGSLIVSAQWVDKQAGLGYSEATMRHPLYNRPPEIVIELAGHEGGTFLNVDEPGAWNASRIGSRRLGGVR